MALDAPPVPAAVGHSGGPGLARRYAGVAVCGGVVALVLAVGIHEARRAAAPRSASVLATEPITPSAAPAPTALPTTVPVTAAPVATVPVTAAAPAVTAAPAPVVAVTAVTAPERVFPLGALCWPLGASARSAAGAPIMCTRLDPSGQAYPDGHARWRRT